MPTRVSSSIERKKSDEDEQMEILETETITVILELLLGGQGTGGWCGEDLRWRARAWAETGMSPGMTCHMGTPVLVLEQYPGRDSILVALHNAYKG